MKLLLYYYRIYYLIINSIINRHILLKRSSNPQSYHYYQYRPFGGTLGARHGSLGTSTSQNFGSGHNHIRGWYLKTLKLCKFRIFIGCNKWDRFWRTLLQNELCSFKGCFWFRFQFYLDLFQQHVLIRCNLKSWSNFLCKLCLPISILTSEVCGDERRPC